MTNSNLFKTNLGWAARLVQSDPDVFRRKTRDLKPKLLWLGCSDNALSSLETAAFEGEGCLVHRNVGNQASAHDPSFLATLAYALQTAQVERIVICGHYGCDCIRSVLRQEPQGMGDGWVTPIRTLHKQHRRCIDEIVSEDAQIQTLCELNVRYQVKAVADLPLVESRLAVGSLKIEGVVWSSRDGLLRDPGIVPVRVTKAVKGDRRAPVSLRVQAGSIRDRGTVRG